MKKTTRRGFMLATTAGGIGAWAGLTGKGARAEAMVDACRTGIVVPALAEAGVAMAQVDIHKQQVALRKDGVYLENVPAGATEAAS